MVNSITYSQLHNVWSTSHIRSTPHVPSTPHGLTRLVQFSSVHQNTTHAVKGTYGQLHNVWATSERMVNSTTNGQLQQRLNQVSSVQCIETQHMQSVQRQRKPLITYANSTGDTTQAVSTETKLS